MNTEERRQVILDWLGIESDQLCKRCGGRGQRLYGSTATWRGGIGGQVMTTDTCNACWGTGRSDKKGLDLRRVVLATECDELKARVKELEVALGQAYDHHADHCASCRFKWKELHGER